LQQFETEKQKKLALSAAYLRVKDEKVASGA
jgi:hypothetical protein